MVPVIAEPAWQIYIKNAHVLAAAYSSLNSLDVSREKHWVSGQRFDTLYIFGYVYEESGSCML